MVSAIYARTISCITRCPYKREDWLKIFFYAVDVTSGNINIFVRDVQIIL